MKLISEIMLIIISSRFLNIRTSLQTALSIFEERVKKPVRNYFIRLNFLNQHLYL